MKFLFGEKTVKLALTSRWHWKLQQRCHLSEHLDEPQDSSSLMAHAEIMFISLFICSREARHLQQTEADFSL